LAFQPKRSRGFPAASSLHPRHHNSAPNSQWTRPSPAAREGCKAVAGGGSEALRATPPATAKETLHTEGVAEPNTHHLHITTQPPTRPPTSSYFCPRPRVQDLSSPTSGARTVAGGAASLASKLPVVLLVLLRPAEGGCDHPSPNTQPHRPRVGGTKGATCGSPGCEALPGPNRGRGMARRVKRCCRKADEAEPVAQRTSEHLRPGPAEEFQGLAAMRLFAARNTRGERLLRIYVTTATV
jgi:hypothetical protein